MAYIIYNYHKYVNRQPLIWACLYNGRAKDRYDEAGSRELKFAYLHSVRRESAPLRPLRTPRRAVENRSLYSAGFHVFQVGGDCLP